MKEKAVLGSNWNGSSCGTGAVEKDFSLADCVLETSAVRKRLLRFYYYCVSHLFFSQPKNRRVLFQLAINS